MTLSVMLYSSYTIQLTCRSFAFSLKDLTHFQSYLGQHPFPPPTSERLFHTVRFFCHHLHSIWQTGNGTPLQDSCLENPMDGGAWWAAVYGVAQSRTRLSDFTFTFHFHALEKEMATHSTLLAWRIPGTGEPGGLPSMGSHRVGHDWSDLAAAAAFYLKSRSA